jgi:hypothetical protein
LNQLPVLVPLLALFAFWFFFYLRTKESTPDLREAFLAGAVCWGICLSILTEILSVFDLITFVGILTVWLLVLIALGVLIARQLRKQPVRSPSSREAWKLFDLVVVAAAAVLLLIIAFNGFVSAPNAWDALTYHLSRVMHWIQDHNVRHFPTSIDRQLGHNPGMEYLLLHLQVLSGGDRWANFPQWLSLIVCAVGVSLIARALNLRRRAQIGAAIVCLTIPMAILQASIPKNDAVLAAWLVCFVYYLIKLFQDQTRNPAFLAAGGLALAILTKATAYIFAFPFLIWFFFWTITRLSRKRLAMLALMIVVPLVLNAAHYSRNIALFKNPLGMTEMPAVDMTDPTFQLPGVSGKSIHYSNDVHTPATLLSGILRNAGLHTITPSARLNAWLDASIRKFHKLLGVPINDPGTTWPGTRFAIPARNSYQPNLAGNPVDLVLILICSIYLFSYGWKKDRVAFSVALCLTAGFVLFCAYLRWQPWHSRLHLPLFILWSPLIVLVIERIAIPALTPALMIILLILSYPWLVHNKLHPLTGKESVLNQARIDQYFVQRPTLEQPLKEAVLFIAGKNCANVGFIVGWWNEWEYPWWMMFKEAHMKGIRIEHLNVQNASSVLENEPPFKDFQPCAIIMTHYGSDWPASISAKDKKYISAWRSPPIGIFLPE